MLYSNVTSFIGYIDNTVIQLPIYFSSHMRIDEQAINIIPKFTQCCQYHLSQQPHLSTNN